MSVGTSWIEALRASYSSSAPCRMQANTMDATIIIAGNRVSPPARMAALATIGTTRKTAPGYQISGISRAGSRGRRPGR